MTTTTARALRWLILIGLTGCCFGIGPNLGPNLNGIYTGLETSTATCGDAGPASNTSEVSFQFSGSGSSINYTSTDGCAFNFSVNNNVGTLSNAPVDCSVTNDGGTAQIVVTAYTIDFSDAGDDAQLTYTQTSTFTEDGVTCSVTATGSGAQ